MFDKYHEFPIARRVVQLSYFGYFAIFFVGVFQPQRLEVAVQVIGGFLSSAVGGIDSRLMYSLTLLVIFTLFELARNFLVLRFFVLRSPRGDLSISSPIRSGLFPLLIVAYFLSNVFFVTRSAESQAAWHPIPDLTTFLVDFLTIWAVAYSIVNIVFISLSAIYSWVRS